MTLLSFGADVEVDVLSKEEFDTSIDRVMRRLPTQQQSTWQTVSRAGVADGTNPVVLNFGTPPAGLLWYLLNLSLVGGQDGLSTYAGSKASLCIGDSGLFNGAVSTSNVLIPAPLQSVPCYTTLGGKEDCAIHSNETVFVIISGLSAADQLVGNLRIRSVNASASEAAFI